MSLQSIEISGFKSGTQKNKKPFLLTDDAFAELENAYVYREELRKREGLQLIGRLRRVLTAVTLKQSDGLAMTYTPPGTGSQTINIFTIYSFSGTETNPSVEPGTLVFTLDSGGANETILTDATGLGTLVVTGAAPIISSATINYTTGVITAIFTSAPGALTVTLTMSYFPSLPVMGLRTRDVVGINAEQQVWFDTKYAYLHDGSNFQELPSTDAVTWNGTDADFFWTTNYRGSDAQSRLFFATNFVLDAGSPMRYYNGTTWTTFQPILGGTQVTEVMPNPPTSGAAAYGPESLVNVPVIEGSVKIVVSPVVAGESELIFRDTPKDGTLVSTGSNTGTINYLTGAITLSFNPVLPGTGAWTVTATYSYGTTYLFTARVLIAYYGRLLALNTYEGTLVGNATNFFNRCRFSQIGDPTQNDAWRSDVFGKGGFIDAPTNEDIISATFYKNTLIVHFERSTWRLQYIGEYGTPFIWERISSDYGSESTFSSVLFDNGVLTVGDKAIVASSGNDVQRIDLEIPDEVYRFRNSDSGVKRVHGGRDFQRELVYWCYPDASVQKSDQYYPTHSLLYNYRNNTWAKFRNSITVIGQFQYAAGITWDRLDVFWDSQTVFWDSAVQQNYPVIACGNQQGFCHFYGYADNEVLADSTITLADQESLAITNVVITTVVTLTVPNHNLIKMDDGGEFIYITGIIMLGGATTLNNAIYSIAQITDKDTIVLSKYDPTTNMLITNFSVTQTGTYVGGGVIALLPKMNIRTKDFNPMKKHGMNIKTSYVDFLFDTSTPAAINVLMRMNTNNNNIGNLLIGNKTVEQGNVKSGFITAITKATLGVVTSKNHGLLNGEIIQMQNVLGMTEVNGILYTVTFIDVDSFSIGVDTSGAGYTTYTSGGYWQGTTAPFYSLNANYTWHRFLATCFGQYLSLVLTYTNEQMSQIQTHQQNFVLNAMQIYYRPGGKNIFGK